MGTLSGWIGGDNAMATGESLKKQATGAVKKYATATAKKTGAFVKGIGQQAQAAKSGGLTGYLNTTARLTLGSAMTSLDKSVFGGEAGKLFGGMKIKIGGKEIPLGRQYDDEGKLIKSQLAQGMKSEKERLSTIQTSRDLEEQRKAFLSDDGEKSGSYQFKQLLNAIKDDYSKTNDKKSALKMLNDAVARISEKGLDSNATQDQVDAMLMKTLNEYDPLKKIIKNDEKGDIDIQDVKSLKREGDRQRNRLVNSGLDTVIENYSNSKGTVVGGRSVVEDTMMERQEIKVLQEIRDLLGGSGMKFSDENMSKLAAALNNTDIANGKMAKAQNDLFTNPHGSKEFQAQVHGLIAKGEELQVDKISGNGLNAKQVETSFAKIADQATAYNSALVDKKQAEANAKAATEAMIKEFENAAKGNKLAEKAVAEFAKAMKYTVKDFEELSKKLKDILKK